MDKIFDYLFWFVGGDATEIWFVGGKEWLSCSEDLDELQVNTDTQKCSAFGQPLQAKFLASEGMCEPLQFIENSLVLSCIWPIGIDPPDGNG